MKRTKYTIATTFAALMIGSLTINTASAAVKIQDQTWGDLNSVTHSAVVETGQGQAGHVPNEFSRTDLSAVTHRSVPLGTTAIGRDSGSEYSRNDLTATTHHN